MQQLILIAMTLSSVLMETRLTCESLENTEYQQTDPKLIQLIKDCVLFPPSRDKEYNLSKKNPNLRGQFDQAVEVDRMYGGRLEGRFFIEAGAWDGEFISNTLLLEMERGWTGLLVEPNPAGFKALQGKQRKAWTSPACLSTEQNNIRTGFMAEGVGGALLQDQEDNHGEDTQVTCVPLYSLLLALDNPTVDYMSLDIEGAELSVLKTVPWESVDIRMLGVETNHAGETGGSRWDIISYLESQGYEHIGTIGIDDFFIKNNKVQLTHEHRLYISQLVRNSFFEAADRNKNIP